MTFNLKNKSFAIFISTLLLLFCTSSIPTPSVSPTPLPPRYVDIVSCSRTTAGLCTQIDVACSYRNTSTNVVFNGKCKNETINGLTFCRCSVIENTAEGCTQWITDPIAGRCYEQNQQCIIQGSGPSDPNRGRRGICTNRNVTNAEGRLIRTCSCQLPPFEDIVSCSRTTAGLCSEVNANCSYRDNSNGQVINGKCKNITSNGREICICDITEDTAEGCKRFIGGPTVGACYTPNQECTYQGSGPDDPDRGSRGVCVTRTEIDLDSNNQVLRCRCNERAVCGDDRIDIEQGEVCEPPGRPTDGCGEGDTCSNDCRYCIPPNPCLYHSGNRDACTSTQCNSSGTQRNCVYYEDTQTCGCPEIF